MPEFQLQKIKKKRKNKKKTKRLMIVYLGMASHFTNTLMLK